MRLTIIASLLIAGCGQQASREMPVTNVDVPSQSDTWDLVQDGEGAVLSFAGATGEPKLRLFCPAGGDRLVVNVASFQPIASEERLSFGQGGEVVALVADPSGDRLRGGVTAEAPTPSNLLALLSGQVSASYGAQESGPHPTPPAALVNPFVEACTGEAQDGDANGQAPAPTTSNQQNGSACLTGRDGRSIPANRIKAVGTEPFWAAQVEGRCVTYSHPENQSGTRVWTQFSGTTESGTWSGFLDEQPFVMRTRPQQGCSDGMSDKRYPIAVELRVRGEERRGCAEPS